MTAKAYEILVHDALAPGFTFHELVNEGLQNKQLPPVSMRTPMVRLLQIANALRTAMMNRGAHGLLLHAAYRPKGGATRSAHKTNEALDLDLLPGDYDMADAFVVEGVTMLCTLGHNEDFRLGVYGKPGSCKSIRLHIDTKAGARGWQHYGDRVLTLAQSDIPKVAQKLGLPIPARRKA